MTPIDPKLIALAKTLRPDLAKRLIVMKATEAGRGILIKPVGRPPMPARPPMPSTPDAGAAKAAVLLRPSPDGVDRPQGLAISAYEDQGAASATGAVRDGSQAPAGQDRLAPGAAAPETPGRGIPFAIAQLPHVRTGVRHDPADESGRGREDRTARRGLVSAMIGVDPASRGRAGLVALALALVVAAVLAGVL